MTQSSEFNDEQDSQLISIVAHDLKTPVTATRGFLDLVQNTGPLTELQQKYLNRAFMSLGRMEIMISSLLDWARLSAGKPLELAVVDLRGLVDEAYQLVAELAEQRDITTHLYLGDKPAMVSVDEQLMGQAITNLLSNAIKYNREGGQIIVTLTLKAQEVQVDVRDTGPGIDPELLDKIFDRFFRATKKDDQGRRIEGTGLGLAISQVVIELHGGRIWVESAVGEGSTFSFALPVRSAPFRDSEAGKSRNKRRKPNSFNEGHGAGEIIDDVDDDLQERRDRAEREPRRDDA
ncbi:MAG: sensor histidine kinase [Chloroflexota bacterium]